MRTRIIGTGSYLPETVVTNDDLSKIMDTSDEWISSRTGIRERRLVKEETTASMSVAAAERAMENAGVSPQEIDLIIVGTITGDCVTPSMAIRAVQSAGPAHILFLRTKFIHNVFYMFHIRAAISMPGKRISLL